MILAEGSSKPKKDFAGAAIRWFGLLGVVAAAAALVLVPVFVDPEAVLFDPGVAYYGAQLRVFLIASAVLLVSAIGILVFDKRPLRFPALIPALVLLGVSALSTLFSTAPANSLYGDRGQGLLSIAAGVLLFFVLAQALTSRARLRALLAAATTAAALISIYGIVENFGFEPVSGWGNVPFTDLGRSSATIGNSLTLAAYLTLMMGAAAALWFGAGTRLKRLVWLVALALIGACWIYAETRGALLGAGVALPLVLLAARRKTGTLRPFVVPVAVLVAAMAVAVAVSAAFGFSTLSLRLSAVLLAYLALVGIFAWLLERGRTGLALVFPMGIVVLGVAALATVSPGILTPSSLGFDRAAASSDGDVSMQTRLYMWRDAVPMILDRPLLGYGPDNFEEPFRPYISEDLESLITSGRGEVRGLDRAHNHLLQLAATTGLLGLGAYLWLVASFLRNAYKRGGWVLAALSGAVLAYLLQLLTAFPSVATDVAFWGILGASVAVMRLREREGRGPTEGGDPHPAPGSTEAEGRTELPVAAVVAVILIAAAVPVSLQQRERVAEFKRAELSSNILQTVEVYRRVSSFSGTYPEAGVYTRENPVRNARGRPAFRPAEGVTIRTRVTPENEFTVEGRSATLAGTFESSYNSARPTAPTDTGGG